MNVMKLGEVANKRLSRFDKNAYHNSTSTSTMGRKGRDVGPQPQVIK